DTEVRLALEVDVAPARCKPDWDAQPAVGVEGDLRPVEQPEDRPPPLGSGVLPQRGRPRDRVRAEPPYAPGAEQDYESGGDRGRAPPRRHRPRGSRCPGQAAPQAAPGSVGVVG